MKEIEAEMNYGNMTNFEEWSDLNDLMNEEYFQEQFPALERFFNSYIKGRSIKEIEPKYWDTYSDWHKDVFGFRPRQTDAIGV